MIFMHGRSMLMKKIRFFKCPKDHITERVIEDNIVVVACGECKDEAARMLAAARYFGNTIGKSPAR